MKPWILAGSTALALLYATGAVQADVTPEDVWTNWKSAAEGYGQTIASTSEAREGDTLVVKGVTITMDQDGTKATGGIDEMRLKDNGDGTVTITASDTMTTTVDTPAVDGQDAAKVTVTVSMPGMSTKASGTPDAVSYDMTAPNLKVSFAGADAADASKGAGNFDVALTGAQVTYNVANADQGKKIDYKVAAKSAVVTGKVTDPSNNTDVNLNLSVADIAGTSSGLFLGAEAMKDMAAALKAGFGFSTETTYGAGTYTIDTTSAGQPTKVSGDIGSGSFSISLDHGKFQMASGSKDVTVKIDSAELPIPDLSGSYGEASFSLLMPLEKSDTPSDFAMGVKLVDLKISDSLWGMVDPTGALPHDPATLIIDTKGTATLSADLTDTAAMEALADAPPGMLNSFDLTGLDLKVAGAELTGNGAFTFDNSDMESFQGMPAPTGKLDLKAVGLNGLIDKLVQMGLVPQDQAMQGKMMMGMFAQPGEGEDTLTSTIEVKDKKLTINGMEMPMQ